MATIIRTAVVCDGFDVAVRLDDGRLHLFHFIVAPLKDLQKAVDALAAALPPPPKPSNTNELAKAAEAIFSYVEKNPLATAAQLKTFIVGQKPVDVTCQL